MPSPRPASQTPPGVWAQLQDWGREAPGGWLLARGAASRLVLDEGRRGVRCGSPALAGPGQALAEPAAAGLAVVLGRRRKSGPAGKFARSQCVGTPGCCAESAASVQRCPSQRGAQHWKLPSQMRYLFFLEAGSHMPKLAECPQVTASSRALSCSPMPAALPHLQQVARAGWDPVPHTRRVLCLCSQVPHRLGTPHLVQPHAQRVPPACPSPRTSPLCPAQPDLLLCAVPVPSRCAPAARAACSQRPLNTRYQAPARQSYF